MPSWTPAGEAADLLRVLPVFGALSPEDLADLAAQCRSDTFRAGEMIFHQGDPCTRIWLIHQGQVKIVLHDQAGREVVPEILSDGEPFGGGTIFLANQPASAQALTDVATLSFSCELYISFLLEHPKATLSLIRMLAARLQSFMAMNALAGERVERRLAHILLKLANRAGQPDREGILITLPLSRQDLADMSGTTIETAIRIMSRFRAEGLVKTRRGGFIVLLDEEGLQQLART